MNDGLFHLLGTPTTFFLLLGSIGELPIADFERVRFVLYINPTEYINLER